MLKMKDDDSVTESDGSMAKKVSNGPQLRWRVLLLYGLINITNSMTWVTFSPISDETADYFDHIGGDTAINMLAVVFCIFYLPGTILAIFSMKKLRVRGSLLLGGSLTFIGTLFRFIGTVWRSSLKASGSYSFVLLGQIMCSLAQPLFTNLPAALCSSWFPVSERDIATTIASMCNPLGNAIGQIMPSIFVSKRNNVDDDADATIDGMPELMITQCILAFITLLLNYLFFVDEPDVAPSISTLKRKQGLGGDVSNIDSPLSSSTHSIPDISTIGAALHGSDLGAPLISPYSNSSSNNTDHRSLSSLLYNSKTVKNISVDSTSTVPLETDYSIAKNEIQTLLRNKDYRILLFVFSMVLGIFNALIALMNQMIEDYSYSNDDAGYFGALLVGVGIVFAGVVGLVLDRTHLYRETLLFCLITTNVSMVMFLAMIYANNFDLLCFSSALLGAGVVPLLPVATENVAEITYPVPEDISVGLLLLGGNYFAIALTFLVQELLNIDIQYDGMPLFTPARIFMSLCLLLPTLTLFFYGGKDYRRLKADLSAN